MFVLEGAVKKIPYYGFSIWSRILRFFFLLLDDRHFELDGAFFGRTGEQHCVSGESERLLRDPQRSQLLIMFSSSAKHIIDILPATSF